MAAAIFGGTQSLHTNALDEAIALPPIFLRGLHEIHSSTYKEETNISKVVDPWGGVTL